VYDLIGDIHGYATPLRKLLAKLGYAERDGVWRHPDRQVIFLGDFIDRGPEQLETVAIARGMVEAGAALAVMGNHEFNAIAWATEAPEGSGQYLRKHSKRNRGQHAAFLKAVDPNETDAITAEQREIIEWFKTLPVYLDLDGLRVIHACWHRPSLDALAPYLDGKQCFREDAWPEVTRNGSPAYDAAETLLKGLEVELPGGIEFLDKDKNPRRHIRAKFWKTHKITYRDLAIVPPEVIARIPHEPVPEDILPGYDGDKPLFVGHYWFTGEPATQTRHIACLDYSIAGSHSGPGGSGKLCAYRWDGESELAEDKFVWVSG
jgi:hypothetical protein